MASFVQLKRKARLVEAVFQAIEAANQQRTVEYNAACKIQSMARYSAQRNTYLTIKRAAVHLQRVYRGYRGRLQTLDRCIEREKQRQQLFFTHFAVLIQKTWRGYCSRRWKDNFYEQKEFLRVVVERGEEQRRIGREHYERQVAEKNAKEASSLKNTFNSTAQHLHHLISTGTMAGVYREKSTGLARATAFEGESDDVEDVLRKLKVCAIPISLLRVKQRPCR
eukprot:TRINITY_DN67092_c5_g1_i3.p1 TRINITY_DN67092_c5_g1~~TRINITY_DN67092_c5_g1_i3.p1  ORF type:complete len:223 (+),score=10.01 TRINITY_DN67092_c5_g1_i3:74-742(+)